MATYNELRAQAHEISNRAKVKLDSINDQMSAEDAASAEREFDAMMAEADTIDARAARALKVEEREAAFNAADPRRPIHDGQARSGAKTPAEVYSRAFEQLIRYGDSRLSGEDRSILSRGEVRYDGQVEAVPNLGGNTVPQSLAQGIIVATKAYGPFPSEQACTVERTDNGASITYATVDDTGNMGFMLGETQPAPKAQITTGGITLGAHKATTGVFTISNELLQDSAIDFAQLVIDAAGERIGRLINNKLTVGPGGANEATGIVTALGNVGLTTTVAGALSFDDLLAMQGAVDPTYRTGPKVAYMMNDKTLQSLRKVKTTTGEYLWQPALIAGQQERIAGYNFLINQDMPDIGTGNVAVAFGDWSKFKFRVSRTLAMQRLNELYAVTDQIGLLGFIRFDSNLMDPRAIKGLKVS